MRACVGQRRSSDPEGHGVRGLLCGSRTRTRRLWTTTRQRSKLLLYLPQLKMFVVLIAAGHTRNTSQVSFTLCACKLPRNAHCASYGPSVHSICISGHLQDASALSRAWHVGQQYVDKRNPLALPAEAPPGTASTTRAAIALELRWADIQVGHSLLAARFPVPNLAPAPQAAKLVHDTGHGLLVPPAFGRPTGAGGASAYQACVPLGACLSEADCDPAATTCGPHILLYPSLLSPFDLLSLYRCMLLVSTTPHCSNQHCVRPASPPHHPNHQHQTRSLHHRTQLQQPLAFASPRRLTRLRWVPS